MAYRFVGDEDDRRFSKITKSKMKLGNLMLTKSKLKLGNLTHPNGELKMMGDWGM